jgi:uncharacterized protein YcaQ
MSVHRLEPSDARRIAVRAQLLDLPQPTELVSVVRQLTLLQVDPTAAIAPNADLVAWSRLGSSYESGQLTRALEDDRTLFEFNAMIRPIDDLPLFRAEMAASPPWERAREWLRQNERFRSDILERLEAEGPLQSRDIPDTSVAPWPSTGWTNHRNVTKMLEIMLMKGDIAIASRRGRERIWDLAERVYPPESTVLTPDEARRIRDERRLRALGLARGGELVVPNEPVTVGDAGEEATIDGVPGTWRVDPAALDELSQAFSGRTALLSPFDRLVHDRARTQQLFGFEYTLEMYKPKAQRRWGYFALPILHGDRLIGKVDATADRKAGLLRVHAIHEDTPFTRAMSDDVRRELEALAQWLRVSVE